MFRCWKYLWVCGHLLSGNSSTSGCGLHCEGSRYLQWCGLHTSCGERNRQVCKTSICFLPIVFWWSEKCILGHRCNLAIWISQFPFVTSHVLTLSATCICTRLSCPLGRVLIVKCHYCRGSEDICWPTWFWGSVLSLQFFSGLWMTNSVERIAVFFSQWVVTYIITHPCFCDFIIFKPLDLSLSGWNLLVWLQGKGYPDVATRRYVY